MKRYLSFSASILLAVLILGIAYHVFSTDGNKKRGEVPFKKVCANCHGQSAVSTNTRGDLRHPRRISRPVEDRAYGAPLLLAGGGIGICGRDEGRLFRCAGYRTP